MAVNERETLATDDEQAFRVTAPSLAQIAGSRSPAPGSLRNADCCPARGIGERHRAAGSG
jgi:hypothetical protein